MKKMILTISDTPRKTGRHLALVKSRQNKDIIKLLDNKKHPQLTKQDVEDLDQLLKLEWKEELKSPSKNGKKKWRSKHNYTESAGAIMKNSSRHISSIESNDYNPKPQKTFSKHQLHKQNLPYALVKQAKMLSRNLKKIGNDTDKVPDNLIILPLISNNNVITERTRSIGRNFKSKINKTSKQQGNSWKIRIRKVPNRILRKMKKFERTINNVDKEVENDDYMEFRRRNSLLQMNRSDQLQQTEMLLQEMIIDDPKFIDNLHEYKQQSVTRFIEDREDMKDRLYRLLADPNRVVGRLERQGLIKKNLLKKKKNKPIFIWQT